MEQLQVIQSKIYEIRGQKVMLDKDLAEMYDVQTKVLNQAVKRNIERFPEDFMFQLTDEEINNWRSQFVTSKLGRCLAELQMKRKKGRKATESHRVYQAETINH